VSLICPLAVIRDLWAHPLGARRRLGTLGRYLAWQTLGRLRGSRLLDPWVNESVLHVEHGMTGATGNLYVGLHEFEEMAFLLHFLRPEDLFVDVGANVGSYTVLASAVVGAHVIAFEPVEASLAALRHNVLLNDTSARVDARQIALSDRGATVYVTTQSGAANRIVRPGDPQRLGRQSVPAHTLDGELAGLDPALLKIDVEGHESEVLSGGAGVLADRSLHAVIVEDWGAVADAARRTSSPAQQLAAHGFERCTYDAFQRTLFAQRDGLPTGVNRERRNSLFVRDLEVVRQRLSQAPPFRVLDLSV